MSKMLTRDQIVGLAPISKEEFLTVTEQSIRQAERGQTYDMEDVFGQLERKAAAHAYVQSKALQSS